MICEKHKKYSGIRYPKNGCKNCLEVYLNLQSKTNQYGKYVSITTPTLKCGLSHLLAELSTIMLYGPQPEFFWKQNQLANPESKKYFNQTKTQIGFWFKNSPEKFKAIEEILWTIFVQHWKGFAVKKNKFIEVKDTNKETNYQNAQPVLKEGEIDFKQTIESFFNED